MRTLTTVAILAAAAGLFGSAFFAQAKGPFRAEVSGGGLTEPVTIEGPLPVSLIFGYDSLPVPAPPQTAPSYTVKLMPEHPDGATGEHPVMMTLTYFPAAGGSPALLKGDWEPRDRYFQATPEFEAVLEDAIDSTVREAKTADGDDGVSAVWYIAPSLAAVGLVMIGGLAGRRLLVRHDD